MDQIDNGRTKGPGGTTVPAAWLEFHRPAGHSALRLFCFPFAGGSAALFRDWQPLLEGIEVCPIQLPGRGRRIGETCATELRVLAAAVADAIQPACAEPFALFGHSMGGLIGYEVARLLEQRHRQVAAHLIVASVPAPHLVTYEAQTYDVPYGEFIEHLRGLDGTPKELLESKAGRELFLPIIRADFRLVQTYHHVPGPRLSCPIVAIVGHTDPSVSAGQVAGWNRWTSNTFTSMVVNGDHFLLPRRTHDCLRIVRQALRPPARARGTVARPAESGRHRQ